MSPTQQQRFDFVMSQSRNNLYAELLPILQELGFDPYSKDKNLMAFENDDGEMILVSDNAATELLVTIGDAVISLYEADSDEPIQSSQDLSNLI